MSRCISQQRRRPLIVLGGWLGCQPKYLKAYEKLYDRLGFDTLSFLPTPKQIIECCIIQTSSSSSRGQHEQQYNNFLLDDIAYQIRESILERYDDNISKQQRRNENDFVWFYHGFSNGGCFLWKHLQPLLLNQPQNQQILEEDNYQNSSNKNKNSIQPPLPSGIIFDSGPVYFDKIYDIQYALRYCTKEEIDDVNKAFPIMILGNPKNQQKLTIIQPEIEQQSRELFEFLVSDEQQEQHAAADVNTNNNNIIIPHLYLYSEKDEVTSSTKIRQLINKRRKHHQQQKLKQQNTNYYYHHDEEYCFENSNHCAHYKQHPQEYQYAITKFISRIMDNNNNQILPSSFFKSKL